MSIPIEAKPFISRPWMIGIALLLFATLSAAMYAIENRAAQVLLAVCGAALVIVVVVATYKRVESQLHCESLPAKIGHQIRGYVAINGNGSGDESFWVVLRCTELRVGTDGTDTKTIWQDELLVETTGIITTPGSMRIPFEFNMPTAGKSTSSNVTWCLEVTSRGFAAQFPLPVIRTTAAPTVPDEQLRPFSTVRDSLRH